MAPYFVLVLAVLIASIVAACFIRMQKRVPSFPQEEVQGAKSEAALLV